MLQIISGKFFKSEDRHIFDGKGILYSNYAWVSPSTTCIGTLEPVDSYRAVSSYVFTYKNQIERGSGKGAELLRVGDPEIVRQFMLLCIFGLRAYFAGDRTAILTTCRTAPLSSSDLRVPSQFASRIVDAQIQGNVEEVAQLIRLVEKVISLPRANYRAVISVLDNLEHAIQVVSWNLDLAYSIIVYCLESLAQNFDQYTSKWEDFDANTRKSVDASLAHVDPPVAEDIRSALLKGSHLKLSARFLDFIEAHVRDSYFSVEAARVQNPLRRTFLRRSIKNAYVLRSGYVHRLQPIREQLQHPAFGKGDTFMWGKEPYLTFNGLLRLTFHVLETFIDRQDPVDTEEYNWRGDLPGTMRFMAAPEYWIWQHEHLRGSKDVSGDIRKRFGGFLHHVVEKVKQKGAITDMRGVLTEYQRMIPNAQRLDRVRMLAVYLIYNALIESSGRVPKWEDFFEKHHDALRFCCIETIVVDLLLRGKIDASYEQCCAVYENFQKSRFGNSSVELPMIVELKLQAELANMALRSGKLDDFAKYLDMMIADCPGNVKAQKTLAECRENSTEVPHEAIFPVFPRSTDNTPPPESPSPPDETENSGASNEHGPDTSGGA